MKVKKIIAIAIILIFFGTLTPVICNADTVLLHKKTQAVNTNSPEEAFQLNGNPPSVWIMHPGEGRVYFPWLGIGPSAGVRPLPWSDKSIIIGTLIYKSMYGVVVNTDSSIVKIEIYADDELKITDDEPEYEWYGHYTWENHWFQRGSYTLKVVGYDDAGSTVSDARTVQAI